MIDVSWTPNPADTAGYYYIYDSEVQDVSIAKLAPSDKLIPEEVRSTTPIPVPNPPSIQ